MKQDHQKIHKVLVQFLTDKSLFGGRVQLEEKLHIVSTSVEHPVMNVVFSCHCEGWNTKLHNKENNS
jgi:hypothetical protein